MRTKECDWGNPETGERFYGIRVFVPRYGWFDVAVGGKPAIFKTPETRDAVREKLRRLPGATEVFDAVAEDPERGADALVSLDHLLGAAS